MSRRLQISVTVVEGTPPSDAEGPARKTAAHRGSVLDLRYTGELDTIETSDGAVIKSGNGMTIHTFEADIEPAETQA
ncbi:hypothetical protein ACGFNU_21375 [Spirillospora sp. NPDC048911]|uniref:hypothetical protein n=1 Tax=Spirillospora sp. NPDC048911 TaxID=3364527 RepID=UPI00372251DE